MPDPKFDPNVEALIDAIERQDAESSEEDSDEEGQPPPFAADLDGGGLGGDVGDMLKQFQAAELGQQKAQEEKRESKKKAEAPKSAQPEAEVVDESPAKAKGFESSPPMGPEPSEGSVSSASYSDSSSNIGNRPRKASSNAGVLNGGRQKIADQIFTAGASDVSGGMGGSLDAALLREAVMSIGEGEEWEACQRALEGAKEESFGLCRPDFHIWIAEMFSEVSNRTPLFLSRTFFKIRTPSLLRH